MVSSGLLRRVALVRTYVWEELSVSFIRVTRIGKLGTTLAVTSNRRMLRRNFIVNRQRSYVKECITLCEYTVHVWRNTFCKLTTPAFQSSEITKPSNGTAGTALTGRRRTNYITGTVIRFTISRSARRLHKPGWNDRFVRLPFMHQLPAYSQCYSWLSVRVLWAKTNHVTVTDTLAVTNSIICADAASTGLVNNKDTRVRTSSWRSHPA
jgi:hypothetical protein